MQKLSLQENYFNRWIRESVREEEIKSYLDSSGNDFINEKEIDVLLTQEKNPAPQKIKDIIQKSLSIARLNPDEVAALLNVEDEDLWAEIFQATGSIKKKVYDNRIVTFAPLYLSNLCINSCLYCGFRKDNKVERRRLTLKEVKEETKSIVSTGHKRLIIVYGEHPLSDVDYMVDTIRTIYETKIGNGEIRRVNINADPMTINKLQILKEAEIGAYQVFQETYHHNTYKMVHPRGIKSNYKWRLYALHRAQAAGIEDVAMGVLFGLYDWKFEVMGLVYHTIDLEKHFGGIGPHTISFPRLEPAINTPFIQETKYKVSDTNFKKLIAVIRLSVPYTGMILTARESTNLRREFLHLGITQIDASTKIGIGAYSENLTSQMPERQQFILGDTRNLDEVIRELAEMGYITSFCTAGYRCGRTGQNMMNQLKTGKEKCFCKLNAVLTFREWLNDYATMETKNIGENLIKKEILEIEQNHPEFFPNFMDYYIKIKNGKRDIYF